MAKVPGVNVWRTAHGAAAKGGAVKVAEPCADGVRPVPGGVAAPVERREDGTVTPAGAAELGRRRWEVARLPDFGDKAAPWLPPCEELAPFDLARRDLLTQRREEICNLTGGVDSGTGAQIRAWAYIHAAGEYWASKFFASGDPVAFESMVRAFKASSTEDAKLRDAAAWAAAARKAAAENASSGHSPKLTPAPYAFTLPAPPVDATASSDAPQANLTQPEGGSK